MHEPADRISYNESHKRLLLLMRAAAAGFRSLSMAADGGSSDDVGGTLCWYSTSYVPVFNGAAILDEALFTPATINLIERYFIPRGRPYSVMTLDALAPRATGLLAPLNYVEYDSMPAMWLEGEPSDEVHSSEGVWVKQIESPVPLGIFRRILSEVFHLGMSEVNLVLGERTLNIAHVRHYLAWIGSVPVGTASLVLSEGVAGVWNVGTLREWRRRGVAATVMNYILADARKSGYEHSMLLASNEGLPLYERMGYRTMSDVRVFVPLRQ